MNKITNISQQFIQLEQNLESLFTVILAKRCLHTSHVEFRITLPPAAFFSADGHADDPSHSERTLVPPTKRKHISRSDLMSWVTTVCCWKGKERFYLTIHSTHFIYSYMASDIWLRTILIVRKETRCCHIGYSFQLAARVLLYAPPTERIAHTTAFVTPVVEHWLEREIAQWVHHEVLI